MSDNESLLRRRNDAIPRGVSTAYPIFAASAANSEIIDVDGRRYIDFAGGIAVLNSGHCHPHVIKAAQDQLTKYTHTAFQVIPYEPYIELAERLNALAPISGPAKTILFSTGAEAVENAVKIAKAATGRTGIVAFAGGFHGRTMLTMAMTGKTSPYKRLFGPLAAEVYHLPFPAEQLGVSVEDSMKALDLLFRADIEPSRVAAIIIEPVQGEGGFYDAPAELIRSLRAVCDRHGIVLIADEVQSGFARTGRMFAIEHSGVAPDLITVAKSLGGGFPISGVIGRAELMDAAEPGSLGGTYAGNPVACAAALAVLDVITEERLMERADIIGRRMRERLAAISRRNDTAPIGGVRGLGAMIGFDVFKRQGHHEPDAEITKRITAAALEDGLIILSCGVHGNVIRLLAPLTVPDDVLEDGLQKLERALITARD